MTDRNIADLCPALQAVYAQWLAQCKAAGLNTKAIVTWRSAADQNKAHDAGLSNARAGESPHNVCDANGNPASCAFDFAIFTAGGAYITDGKDPRYRQAGEIGKGLGLVYGGDFHAFPDEDHLELADWRDAKMTIATARDLPA